MMYRRHASTCTYTNVENREGRGTFRLPLRAFESKIKVRMKVGGFEGREVKMFSRTFVCD